MAEKIKVKKGNKKTGNVISSFVVLTIVLSVLAASVAMVSADGSPTITAVLPENGASLVPVTTTINVTFSEAMNEASVEGAFSITPNVAGSFSWAENNMTFTPEVILAYDTEYNLTIAATAINLAGAPLESAYTWAFHTRPPPLPQPASITVAADPTSIAANGGATSNLTATALKEDGTPAGASWTITFKIISGPSGAVLINDSDGGAYSEIEVWDHSDAEGKAYATLIAGTTVGPVVIEASFTGVPPDTTTVHLYTPGTHYNLAISSTDGGSVTEPGEGTFNYNASDEVSIIATPDTGWQFVDWTGDVNNIANMNANETTITMNDDYAITANFERITYTLTMAVSGNGTVVPPVGNHIIYNAGDEVPINATPDTGWQFVNWTGDVNNIANMNANETTITMNGNYVITANFERIVYGVDLTVTPDMQTVVLNVNATYTLTVKNTGNTEDTFDIAIDDVPANATATLSESVTPELAPDGTYDVSLNVSSAIEDGYIVNVTATSAEDTSKVDYVNTTTTVAQVLATVSIGSAECNVSDTVNVPISITNASNIGAMDINITYNASVLNATNVANGTMIEDLRTMYGSDNVTVAHNVSEAGIATINVSFAMYPPVIDGDGVLFNVTFHAVAVGNSTLDITVKEAWTGDLTPQPVTPITVDGYVNVTGEAGLLGDVNGNGVIDADDSFKTLRASVGLETVDLNIADVNNNGVIDADDSFKILRASVGLETL